MQHIAADSPGYAKKVSSGRWIVYHHMNGCMHCMLFRPAWNEAVNTCKKCEINVTECEYSDMKQLPASMQKVMGFPTIMVYENGKPKAAFNGPRTAEDVADFIKSYAAKPSKAPASAKSKTTATKAKASSKTKAK